MVRNGCFQTLLKSCLSGTVLDSVEFVFIYIHKIVFYLNKNFIFILCAFVIFISAKLYW